MKRKTFDVHCLNHICIPVAKLFQTQTQRSFSSRLNRTVIAYIYRNSVFTALYVNGLYGLNSDRLWVTKILRSAKCEALGISVGFSSTLPVKNRLQFINAPPSSSTDAGQTSV